MKKIDEDAAAVATGQGVFRDMNEMLPGLRMATSGKHCIFCLLRQGRTALILAVLHERTDLMVRLGSRMAQG